MKLRQKLIIGAMLFTLLPLIPIGFFVITAGTTILEESQQRNLININNSEKNYINTLLQQEMRLLKSFVNEYMVQKSGEMLAVGLSSVCQFYLDEYTSIYHDLNTYVSFFVINTDGKIVADTARILKGQNVSQKVFFKEAMQGKVAIGDITQSPDDMDTLHVVAPLLLKEEGEKQRQVGVIGALLRIDSIQNKLREIVLGRTGYLFLVDRNGFVISHPQTEYIQKTIFNLPGFEEVPFNQRIKTFKHVFIDQKKQLVLFMPIEAAQWSLVSIVPEAEYLGAIHKLRNIIVAVGLLFAVFVFFCTRKYFDKLIHKRLNALTEVTKNISRGALHGAIDEQLVTNDEIGSLAHSIDDMRERLKISRDELEGYSKTLQRRVEEGTDEVNRANKALEKLAQDAQSANLLKSAFLANMSHEIRTPMNAIIGMSHLCLGTKLNPQQHNYIEIVHQSSQLLLGIINDILDFSKIEAGKLKLESIPFSMEEVLNNLSNMVSIKAQKKGLEIVFDITPGTPMQLIGDPLRLGQILLNLTANAVKFTESGEIVISIRSVKTDKETVELEVMVRDTGIGLIPEQQSKIFQSFSQADSSTTRKFGGTGLGLAISKHLVQLMKGRIWIESEPGKGSCFYFTTVLGWDNKNEKQVESLTPVNLEQLKVLVVDDVASARRMFAATLGFFSFRVTCVDSAQAAQEALETAPEDDPFRVVLMDHMMPEVNGVEGSRRIKESSMITDIPIILMVTALGRDEVMGKVEEAHLGGFLTKPVTPSVLLDVIMDSLCGKVVLQGSGVTSDRWKIAPLESIRGAQVLLVEDCHVNQLLAKVLLTNAGLQVTIANNGRQAVELADKTRFDVILMDLQMPEMDGFEATQAIREKNSEKQPPIIAMTANAMAGDLEQCLAAGMVDHVAKPIEPKVIFETLAKWIPALEKEPPLVRQQTRTHPIPYIPK